MSTQLVTTQTQQVIAYSQEQIDLIKKTVAKGATNDELSMFTSIAQKYDLDPLIKEIWFIKRAKKVKAWQNGKEVWDYPRLPNGEIDYKDAETIIMTSRDGYLKIAQRDENFRGIIGFPIREGDTFEVDAENYKVTHKFGAKRGPIIGAWAKVDHAKRSPVIVFADFKEYNAPNSTVWKQYPSAMIQKVAEVLALKRQFGISGLVTREEMATVEEPMEPVNITPPAPINRQPEPISKLPVVEPEIIEPKTNPKQKSFEPTAGDKELELMTQEEFDQIPPQAPQPNAQFVATRRALFAVMGELKMDEVAFKQLLSDPLLPEVASEFEFSTFEVKSMNDLSILSLEAQSALVKKANDYLKKQKGQSALGQVVCADCHKPISEKVQKFSVSKYGRGLCMDCQKSAGMGAK